MMEVSCHIILAYEAIQIALVLLKEPNDILFILLYLSQPRLGWFSFAGVFFFFGINADG